MKTSRFATSAIAVVLALVISGITAFAQQTDPEKAIQEKKAAVEKAAAEGAISLEVENKIKAELVTVLGTKLGFETKLVKGAPYSAVAVSETVQTLGDGNRIRQSSSTTIYRDSSGRTRREVMLKDGTVQTIAITDPNTGISYTLNPQNRTATKSEFGGTLYMVELDRAGEDQRKMKAEQELKLKLAQEKRVAEVTATYNANNANKKMPVKESLGKQMIEGVEAEGTRTTTTIPAGQIGNDLPINIVSEQWYSPELQLLVMTKHSDPRTGETTYRLTNINRAEPDHSLFELPADYTLRNMNEEKLELEKKMRAKMAKPEEN